MTAIYRIKHIRKLPTIEPVKTAYTEIKAQGMRKQVNEFVWREETSALTGAIGKVNAEINERVKTLYGVG